MSRFLWWPGMPLWSPQLEAELGVPPAPSPKEGRGAEVRAWALEMLGLGWAPGNVKTAMAQAHWSLSRRDLIVREMAEHRAHAMEVETEDGLEGTGL